MGEWKVGQWIVGVISFQKIFGLCGLQGHIVKIRWGVTLEDNGQRTTECEDTARILKQNSQLDFLVLGELLNLHETGLFFLVQKHLTPQNNENGGGGKVAATNDDQISKQIIPKGT